MGNLPRLFVKLLMLGVCIVWVVGSLILGGLVNNADRLFQGQPEQINTTPEYVRMLNFLPFFLFAMAGASAGSAVVGKIINPRTSLMGNGIAQHTIRLATVGFLPPFFLAGAISLPLVLYFKLPEWLLIVVLLILGVLLLFLWLFFWGRIENWLDERPKTEEWSS